MVIAGNETKTCDRVNKTYVRDKFFYTEQFIAGN